MPLQEDPRGMPKTLTRKQRRVLGTLLEKAFTTPDQYPLTVKATVSGCNQKNNRDPVANYDEQTVTDTYGELQSLGVAGVLHTESGRTERYRHYMRQVAKFTEPQLAILTELLLRGRQQPGELRTRAGRMTPIDSQETLRMELQGLIEMGHVRTSGPLERRGVEVDHTFYPEGENHTGFTPLSDSEVESQESSASVAPAATRHSSSAASSSSANTAAAASSNIELASLREEVQDLKEQVARLADSLEDLRRQVLG
jgi:uncharacterized protein YceH (UPF0502 family)